MKRRWKTSLYEWLTEHSSPLLDEWDYQINEKNGIDIRNTNCRESGKATWRCGECGYVWSASIYKRVFEGTNCPACANMVLFKKHNDLETMFPELAKEWNYEKNPCKPSEVIGKTTKEYWWKCQNCGNEWPATVHNRVAGTNCPRCINNNTSFGEQAVFYYVNEADENAKNRYIEDKTGMEIDIYLPQKRIGIEFDGYRFHNKSPEWDDKKTRKIQEAGIKLIRIRETNYKGIQLPALSVEPDLLLILNQKKRYDSLNCIIADILSYIGVNEKSIIPDTYKDRFLILHQMYQRDMENSFESTESPELVFWDWSANAPLKPSEISRNSGIEVNWKCPECGYSWSRTVNAQRKINGCPVCKKTRPSEKYSLATEGKHIVNEWLEDKNGKRPEDVMPFTHTKYYWKCMKCGNVFKMSPAHRLNGGGCQDCARESSRLGRMKPVLQIDLDTGEVIGRYESAREAEKKTGVSFKHISSCCNGKRNKTGGFGWKFDEK